MVAESAGELIISAALVGFTGSPLPVGSRIPSLPWCPTSSMILSQSTSPCLLHPSPSSRYLMRHHSPLSCLFALHMLFPPSGPPFLQKSLPTLQSTVQSPPPPGSLPRFPTDCSPAALLPQQKCWSCLGATSAYPTAYQGLRQAEHTQEARAQACLPPDSTCFQDRSHIFRVCSSHSSASHIVGAQKEWMG